MKMRLNELQKLFLTAKTELDLIVMFNFEFHSNTTLNIVFPILLRDFGDVNGIFIHTSDIKLNKETRDNIRSAGYTLSQVSTPSASFTFDRDGFIETLSDWGWTGTTKKPTWLKQESR